MIGDKRLDMPETIEDALKTLCDFKMSYTETMIYHKDHKTIFQNAKRLVELNNEVYDRLHKHETESYEKAKKELLSSSAVTAILVDDEG